MRRVIIHLDNFGLWTATLIIGREVEEDLGGSYSSRAKAELDARLLWDDVLVYSTVLGHLSQEVIDQVANKH